MTGAAQTIRQRIVDLLVTHTLTALEISQRLHIAEKEVYRHLVHIEKSVAGKGRRLTMVPCTCQACGFQFTRRTRLTRPGRCPRCRQSRIDQPQFRIES